MVSEGKTGLDVSRLMFGFDLKCFKEKGYTFVVVRAYRTIGCFPDPDGSDTLVKASEAGFEDIDIYMSPCPVGGGIKPAASQVEEMSKSGLAGQSFSFSHALLDLLLFIIRSVRLCIKSTLVIMFLIWIIKF